MELSAKLNSLSHFETVNQLKDMLKNAHVSISWWGQRLVSIDGFEGSVEINQLAAKYLRAEPFDRNTKASLKDRLECNSLWKDVKELYTKSNDELEKTYLYRFLTPLKELRPWCRACAGDPLAIINEWEFGSKKESLFTFTPEEFKKMWPDTEPNGKSWFFVGGEKSEKWKASKSMVEDYLKKNRSEAEV